MKRRRIRAYHGRAKRNRERYRNDGRGNANGGRHTGQEEALEGNGDFWSPDQLRQLAKAAVAGSWTTHASSKK